MAIINNPNQERIEIKPSEGIIKTPPPPIPGPGIGGDNHRLWKVIGITSGVLIGIAIVVYFTFINKPSESIFEIPKPKPISLDSAVISLELEKMMRVDGLINLLEKKIARTEVSLEKALKLKDDVLIDTLRLVLANNLETLTHHQQAFIGGLLQMHQWYLKNPRMLSKLLKKNLTISQSVYKKGNVKTIDKIITLIKSVPKQTKPLAYFKEKIMRQKG